MVVAGMAVKQLARHGYSLSEKASISPVLLGFQHKLYFFFIVRLYIDIVRGKNADRFFKLKDPNCFRLIAIGDTLEVGTAGVSLTDDDAGKSNYLRLIFKTLSRDRPGRRKSDCACYNSQQ